MVSRDNLQEYEQEKICSVRDYACLLRRDVVWSRATGSAKSINSDGYLRVLSDGKLVDLYSGYVHLK